MDRQSITIEGYELSYLEANSSSTKIIFFFHGNSGSARLWCDQLEDLKFSSYRMIAFDLPGHGCSFATTKPLEIYNVITMGSLLAEAVLKLAGKQPYVLLGLSLGTNIVGEMLAKNINPNGIGLISATVVGEPIKPGDVVMEGASATVLYEDDPSPELLKQYIDETHYIKHPLKKAIVEEDYMFVKPFFRSSLKVSIPAGRYSDEIQLIRKSNLPVLSVYGKKERITNPSLLDNVKLNYWKNQVFKFEDAGHLVVLDQPRKFNNLLEEFLLDVLKNSPVQSHT